MALPSLTPLQQGQWHDDRRPDLYISLSILLFLNNLVVISRLGAHYYAYYRHERFFGLRNIFVEDAFILMSALCVNVIISNLLASTTYGLGLHSWRINTEDSHYPRNLSDAFKHVWITMVFTGPTFTFIKLTLLFFYRRLFLVDQKWLKVAWWANLVYVILWFFGATGFYIFQCWPVQWYYLRYYAKYDHSYTKKGQCNATNTTNVSLPLIFGLASDVAILLLPVFTITRLKLSRKKKVGLCGVFSIGILACAMDLARIIELKVDTDDAIDPSYGVVIFLILSAATEVAAIICACLPVIVPIAFKAYKRHHRSDSRATGLNSSNLDRGSGTPYTRGSRGFALLKDASLSTTIMGSGNNHATAVAGGNGMDKDGMGIPLSDVGGEKREETPRAPGQLIVRVERQVDVDYGENPR